MKKLALAFGLLASGLLIGCGRNGEQSMDTERIPTTRRRS
jgi:hypothetical protein